MPRARHPWTRPWLGLAVVAALASAGCGYQAVRYSETFGDQNRIAVHGFRNDTLEAGVDGVVTDAMSREILRRGALRLVDADESADWVMTGVVTRLDVYNRSFSSVAFSLEYEVFVTLDVTITHRDGRTLPLGTNALRARERYLASADPEVARTNREEAIRRVAGQLASRIHDAFYERATVGATGAGSP